MKLVTSSIKAQKPLWLISGAVAVIMILLGIFIYDSITESTYQNSKLYQTALKVKNANEFNYSIDTHQGNVLAEGRFELLDRVKFPEMTKEFPYVHRTKYEYTRHEHEECDYDDDGNETDCHTEVDYSWDYSGEDILEGKRIKFNNRIYSVDLFNKPYIQGINAFEIIKGETEEYWYPERKKTWLGGDSEGNIRYRYEVASVYYNGSILVNTSEGRLKPLNSSIVMIERDSVKKRVADAKSSAEAAKVGFIVGWIFLMLIVVVPLSIYLYNPDILDT